MLSPKRARVFKLSYDKGEFLDDGVAQTTYNATAVRETPLYTLVEVRLPPPARRLWQEGKHQQLRDHSGKFYPFPGRSLCCYSSSHAGADKVHKSARKRSAGQK